MDISLYGEDETRKMMARYDLVLEVERLLAANYFRPRTDRQLREMNRRTREVKIWLTEFYNEPYRGDLPVPLTKKEKCIQKKLRRRTERFLKQTKQGEKSLLVDG
jgi:hypothetical protein